MTAIRTSQQNAYEGTLASEMGPNDLSVLVDGIGTLTTPCYLVIEMDSDSQREYIFFDGAFTSTTFVTTNIAKRYLPGSAAGSNLTHPAGTKIRTYVGKQQHDDLHDRIDGLSHDDLANINANNHHTKYTDAEAAAKIAADDLYVPKTELVWVDYTPSWGGGGPTIGNGILTGRFLQIGKMVTAVGFLQPGSTTNFGSGGTYVLGLPVTRAAQNNAREGFDSTQGARIHDGSIGYTMVSRFASTTQIYLVRNTDGGVTVFWDKLNPFTLAQGDKVHWMLTYEAA